MLTNCCVLLNQYFFFTFSTADAKSTPSSFSDITFIGHRASLPTFFYRAYSNVDLFTYFRAFLTYFILKLLMPLYRTYLGRPRNVGPRIKRGYFSIRLLNNVLQLNKGPRYNGLKVKIARSTFCPSVFYFFFF